jgi:molybdate transport system ATP-binding protein
MITMTASEYLYVNLQQQAPIPLAAEFTCSKNELIVLVGPSGSGKTTLLRSIAGLHHVKEAIVKVDNETWCDHSINCNLPTQQRHAGFVFQHYALFPHFTVAENVGIAMQDKNKISISHEVSRILSLVNLEGLEQRYPAQLSGGQQQRVALARALARNPKLLLLDEPFSAVDLVTRRKLRRELVKIRQQLDIPIIFVTHDLDEAYMLADRLFIIHEGHLLQSGRTDEVISRPVNAKVARLIDQNNIFRAKVKSHNMDKGLTLLQWKDTELECALDESFIPGETVDWLVPSEGVILHRVDRPSRGERENPVEGIIDECISLGENTQIIIRLSGLAGKISFAVPTHVARRNNLTEEKAIRVSLLANAIHLMKAIERK